MIIELFAGPGGWSEGLRIAGYRGFAVGIELDRWACRTAVAAGHQRIQADVATYPLEPMVGKVDGLIASPPCQAWSSAGNGAGKADQPLVEERLEAFAKGRQPARCSWLDERSKLVAEPMRWVYALRPRWIALEQVPPVLEVWEYMAVLLRRLGYAVWTGIVHAECYGVPQTRKRAILTARLDCGVSRPTPTHQRYRSGEDPDTAPDLFGDPLPPPVSMAQALGWDGVACGQGNSYATGWTLESAGRRKVNDRTKPRQVDDPAMTVAFGHSDMQWTLRSNYGTNGDPGQRGQREPAPTVTGKINRNIWLRNNNNNNNACVRNADEPAGTLFFGQRSNKVDWVLERPATTVCGDARLGNPGHRDREGGERQFGEDAVRVTVREAAILQSFRADFPWQGTKSKQFEQCGNAIPVLLAAAILRPLLSVQEAA